MLRFVKPKGKPTEVRPGSLEQGGQAVSKAKCALVEFQIGALRMLEYDSVLDWNQLFFKREFGESEWKQPSHIN